LVRKGRGIVLTRQWEAGISFATAPDAPKSFIDPVAWPKDEARVEVAEAAGDQVQ